MDRRSNLPNHRMPTFHNRHKRRLLAGTPKKQLHALCIPRNPPNHSRIDS